jgi:Cdc6-like AAA superfamily ATPase
VGVALIDEDYSLYRFLHTNLKSLNFQSKIIYTVKTVHELYGNLHNVQIIYGV